MGQKRAAKVAKRKAKKKKRLAVLNKPASPRECGECYGCCVVFKVRGVPGYDEYKPSGEVCSFVRGSPEGNCSIYDQRPKGCSAFKCLWLRDVGVLRKSERPDKCGVVFNAPPMDHPVVKTVKSPVVVARFISKEFSLTAMQTVERLVTEGYVVIKVIGDLDYEIVAKDQNDANKVRGLYQSLPAFSVLR